MNYCKKDGPIGRGPRGKKGFFSWVDWINGVVMGFFGGKIDKEKTSLG